MSFLDKYPEGFEANRVSVSSITSIDELEFVQTELVRRSLHIRNQLERGNEKPGPRFKSEADWRKSTETALGFIEEKLSRLAFRKKELQPARVAGDPLAFEMFYVHAKAMLSGESVAKIIDSFAGCRDRMDAALTAKGVA